MIQKNRPVLKLIGEDGNAFSILGKARRVALDNGLDWKEIEEKARSGDYNNLLRVMMEYFEVE